MNGVGCPRGVAVDPTTDRIYVTHAEGDSLHSLSVIDGQTNTLLTTVSVGYWPYRVAVNPSNHRVFTSDYNGNDLSVLDGTNNTFLGTVPLGGRPVDIAVNPRTGRIYVGGGLWVLQDYPLPPSVGGIAELPAVAGTSGSGMGGATYAAMTGAAAGVLAFAVLAGLTVRRWKAR